LGQVGRLKDRDVDVAVLELVAHQVFLGVLLELLQRPVGGRRAQPLVGVEALDPALRVLLGAGHPVVRGGVPVVHVTVDDEVLLAILLVHGVHLLRAPAATWVWPADRRRAGRLGSSPGPGRPRTAAVWRPVATIAA